MCRGIVQPIDKLTVSVEYENNPTRLLQLLVVPGRGPNLIGRDWLNKMQLNWSAVHNMECDDFLQPYGELFKEGLFVYTRLPFGVSSAPSLFQRTMVQLLQGIPMTATYLDDVSVSGCTVEEHHNNLRQVLDRLRDAGLRLRKEKCSFMLPSVTYLGHTIVAEGIHPTKDKLLAVQNAPSTSNVGQLRSYLGMLNYYRKFMPNLSTSARTTSQGGTVEVGTCAATCV